MVHHSTLLILCIVATLVCAASSSSSNDDEPLKFLFDSFMPSAFMEKPVKSPDGKSPKNSDDTIDSANDAKAAELLKRAENMISGFKNIIDGLNAPDNGNCVYKCPNGAQPRPLPGFKSVPNGCGSHDINIDVSDLPGITECCNQHDICYGTCNSGQLECDRHFNTCMADACEKLRSTGVITTKQRFTECMATGAAFHLAAMAAGCEFYRDAQRAACVCAAAPAAGAGDAASPGADEELDKQAKIRQYNSEKRAREASQPPDPDQDPLDNIDLSSPVFDLPEAVDRDEL